MYQELWKVHTLTEILLGVYPREMIMDLYKDSVTTMPKTWINFNVQYKSAFIDWGSLEKKLMLSEKKEGKNWCV